MHDAYKPGVVKGGMEDPLGEPWIFLGVEVPVEREKG